MQAKAETTKKAADESQEHSKIPNYVDLVAVKHSAT